MRKQSSVERCLFRKEGEYWTITYQGGAVVRIRETKGLDYISRILRNPGAKIHATELSAARSGNGQNPEPYEAERARQRISKAIKAAIQRIAQHDVALGYHLSTAIRTGTFCSYNPDPTQPICWSF